MIKRATCYIALSVFFAGCGDRPDSASHGTGSVIRAGMALDEAHRIVLSSGGQDITDAVSIVAASPTVLRWHELPDGTAMCVSAHPAGDGASLVVTSIELGEKGQGCGDKLLWSRQKRAVSDSVDLSAYK